MLTRSLLYGPGVAVTVLLVLSYMLLLDREPAEVTALRSPFSSTTLLAHRAKGAGRGHGEARGAPGVGRGEDVSESVAKASQARKVIQRVHGGALLF